LTPAFTCTHAGRHTRFWEGGEGCRDKSKLDPRDCHKYRGSKVGDVQHHPSTCKCPNPKGQRSALDLLWT